MLVTEAQLTLAATLPKGQAYPAFESTRRASDRTRTLLRTQGRSGRPRSLQCSDHRAAQQQRPASSDTQILQLNRNEVYAAGLLYNAAT